MALTETERRVLAAIDAAELRELLRELVARPSPNPPGDERAVATYLADRCSAFGLRVELDTAVAPERPNVYASVGPADGDGLVLLGHIDTVPVGEGWTRPPFDGVVEDGHMYGRGAVDMKAGVAAAACALAALARCEVPLRAPAMLAAVVDEEESGLGVQALLARPGFGARGAIVPEPTALQTIVACRGNCYVDVEITGRSAHAGSPEQGRNAIYGAARLVEAVREAHAALAGERHPLLGAAGWSVGTISGGTGTAMVPDRCRVSIDRRLLPGQRGEDAQAEIDALLGPLAADGLGARSELLMEIPSFEVPPDGELARLAMGAATDAGAPPREPGGWTAACDGGYLMRYAGIPAVVLGPGDVVGQAHKPDESVPLAEVETAARAYALAALRMLS